MDLNISLDLTLILLRPGIEQNSLTWASPVEMMIENNKGLTKTEMVKLYS